MSLGNPLDQFPTGLPFRGMAIRTVRLQWNLLMRLAKRLLYRGQSKKCLRVSKPSRLCPVLQQKGTRAGSFPADCPPQDTQAIYPQRRWNLLMRLAKGCHIAANRKKMHQGLQGIMTVTDVAAEGHTGRIVSCRSSPTKADNLPIFNNDDESNLTGTAPYSIHWSTSHHATDRGTPGSGAERSVRTLYPEVLLEELPGGETSSLRSHGMGEFGLYWNSGGHPPIGRSSIGRPAVSRPCWAPINSAIKLALSIFAPKSKRAIVSLIASNCSPNPFSTVSLHDDPASAKKGFRRSGQYRVLPAPALKISTARIGSLHPTDPAPQSYSSGCGFPQSPPSRR
jgi:hypothetical protein